MKILICRMGLSKNSHFSLLRLALKVCELRAVKVLNVAEMYEPIS